MTIAPTQPKARTQNPPQVFYFAIPLKARTTAQNWNWTVRDFNRTLASIYNQTNPSFRILVACHDVPDISIARDDRLEFIRIDSAAPNLVTHPEANFPDKEFKLRCVADRFRELGGVWFMALDADDLVSSRLVDFVLKNPNPVGFIARQGYVLDHKSSAMALLPNRKIYASPFDQIAGCTIFRLSDSDFNKGENGHPSRFERYVIKADHRQFFQMSVEEGRPLHPLPFPAYTYVINTGDNHSFIYGPHRDWLSKELIPRIREHGSSPTSEVSREFALDTPTWTRRARVAPGQHPSDPNFKAAFIGCAGMKCGSTALWEHLKLHPQIGLAKFKEMRWFDNDDNFRSNLIDYQSYHCNFEKKEGAVIYGEVTPLYLYHSYALLRIRHYNPECKILCIFRNPIERAYSHWCMEVREGREDKSFSEALDLELARHRSGLRRPLGRDYDFSYVGCGLYATQVRDIWKVFPPEQTYFIKTDDLRNVPNETMNEIYSFLELDPFDVPRNLVARPGGYRSKPTDRERQILLDRFEFEIRALERMLGWDCSSWTTMP